MAAAREGKQIAQERFAEMTGLSQSSLSRLESGTGGPNGTPGPPPRIDTIIAIEEAVLLEVAEVAIARSRTQQTQPPQGPRRGRPRRD